MLTPSSAGTLSVESLSNSKSCDNPQSQPWLLNEAMPIVPYLEDFICRTRSLDLVPVPGEDPELNLNPGIWVEPDWSLGSKVLARMGYMDQRILIPNGKRWGIKVSLLLADSCNKQSLYMMVNQ